jgi:hypothetical protein
MPARLSILFLGMTMGGAAFLTAGFACSLIIEQVQYSALDTRVARAVIATDQVSTRAKNAAVVTHANEAQVQYELVSNAP